MVRRSTAQPLTLTSPTNGGVNQRLAAVRRRSAVVEAVGAGATVDEACDAVGIARSPYADWRRRFPTFRAELATARARFVSQGERIGPDSAPVSLDPHGLMVERRRWFGHDTPPFQAEILQARCELPPGSVLMVLLPPEHGKTTAFEDEVCLTLGERPGFRF